MGAPSAALSPAFRAPTSALPPPVGALPSGGGGDAPPPWVPRLPLHPRRFPPSPAGGRITLNIFRFSAIPHPRPPRIALNQYLVQFAVAGGATPPCLRGWCPAPPASLPPHACPSRGRYARSAPPRPCAPALSLAHTCVLTPRSRSLVKPSRPRHPPAARMLSCSTTGRICQGQAAACAAVLRTLDKSPPPCIPQLSGSGGKWQGGLTHAQIA